MYFSWTWKINKFEELSNRFSPEKIKGVLLGSKLTKNLCVFLCVLLVWLCPYLFSACVDNPMCFNLKISFLGILYVECMFMRKGISLNGSDKVKLKSGWGCWKLLFSHQISTHLSLLRWLGTNFRGSSPHVRRTVLFCSSCWPALTEIAGGCFDLRWLALTCFDYGF